MARISENDASALYDIADSWRKDCLIGGKSLLWEGESIWTDQNLQAFKQCFIDNPDESQDSFEEKFKRQLASSSPDVTKLACELILVYFLFPSSVSGKRKTQLIKEIASWKTISISDTAADLMKKLNIGIGGPGLAYNTRRPFEIAYLCQLALELISIAKDERVSILNDHVRFRDLLDRLEEEGTRQSRDILLHLLFPEHYERIASRTHKQLIADAFAEILDQESIPENLDDKLFAIRAKLSTLLGKEKLDFYWPPLRGCWYVSGNSDELNPLQGLSIKKQIVLFGPPGTGKTFEARALADRFVRQGLLHIWGPGRYFKDSPAVEGIVKQRVRRVQFHPGYSYEDLIRGLFLEEGGKTGYKDGVLLKIIDDLEKESDDLKDVPFVLILDEMNRADLSKTLGECFSLLEDREYPVQLAGQDDIPREVSIPSNLYFIGTMNLIDQSLEQVDFALRRRFIWYFRGFDRDQFIAISQERLEQLRNKKRINRDWSYFQVDFESLADKAELINQVIAKHPSLGEQYQIGHTYYCDVVYFIEKDLIAYPGRQNYLFSRKGQGRDKTTGTLWKYSLKPLLNQYLSGVDVTERHDFISQVENILLKGRTD